MARHRPTHVICGCGRDLTADRKSLSAVQVPRHKCPETAPQHLRDQASNLAGWCPIRGFKLLSDYAGEGGSVTLGTKP